MQGIVDRFNPQVTGFGAAEQADHPGAADPHRSIRLAGVCVAPAAPAHGDDAEWAQQVEDALRATVKPAPGELEVAAFAKAAFSLRTLDAELAALHGDPDAVLAARDAGWPPEDPRTPGIFVFRSESSWVEVRHAHGGIAGQLVPPGEGEVTVENPDGERRSAPIDHLGCFLVGPAPWAVLRVRVETTDHRRVVTEWSRMR
ncbi:MAG: hypothetical protein CSA58_00460 [Micrococcales bacterium]|nr:MAG: hypothetical protein CSA58_00460 [Micrococcales bacterium]